MRKHFYLHIILVFFANYLFAVEGTLSKGNGSSFIPKQGSAFSIVLDISSGYYSGKYDILIRINDNTLYNEKDQVDDIYLVFNEPVGSDDIIKIDVKSGQFKFKMNDIDKLPQEIANVLKTQLQNRSDFVREKTFIKEKIKEEPEPKAGFFDKFSSNLSTFFEPKIDEKEVSKNKKPDIKIIENEQIKNTIVTKEITKSYAGVVIGSDSFEKIQNEKIFTSTGSNKLNPVCNIDSIVSEDLEVPNMKHSGISSSIHSSTINSALDTVPSDFTSIKNEIPSFNESDHIEQSIKKFTSTNDFDKISEPKFDDTDVIEQNKLPAFKESITIKQEIPQFKPSQIETVVPQVNTDPTPIYEEVKSIEAVVAPKIMREPEIVEDQEQKQRIVITKTITPKEEPRVLKRHIEPKEYKVRQQEERTPQRMSDRVQRNESYTGLSSSKLRVKAYNNNKPVSAWIEVFKAGSKTRIKTFYTGSGRTLKDVKLPAGVYIIKATYRTASVKKRKNLGRVVIDEGGTINKNIYFDDGKVKIIATKGAKPLYAKVEVFKKGTRVRVTYQFTSRRSGKLALNLQTGKYDIVVRNHSDVLRFDGVNVIAGKTKVFNADF